MATRQRKVERRNKKRTKHRREQQSQQLRHQRRISGDACPIYRCVVNRFWKDDGEATIFIARELAGGGVTMAAFLVDIWAMGLKDAWGRVNLTTHEFDKAVSRMHDDLESSRLDPTTAKHLVYGGIALARDLGFRLPKRYERWTAILGTLPPGESPDMSLFCPGGEIRLIGNMRDLEARLVGSTPEAFLARPDVEYILGSDDFTLVDEDEDQAGEFLNMLEVAALAQLTKWCFAHSQRPHPLLRDVVSAALECATQELPDDLDPNAEWDSLPERFRGEAGDHTLAFLMALDHGHDPAALQAAIAQFSEFMQSEGTTEQFVRTLNAFEG